MFGGGVSSSVGGSSVAERNLNRITIGLTLLWVALIVGLSLFLKAQQRPAAKEAAVAEPAGTATRMSLMPASVELPINTPFEIMPCITPVVEYGWSMKP